MEIKIGEKTFVCTDQQTLVVVDGVSACGLREGKKRFDFRVSTSG